MLIIYKSNKHTFIFEINDNKLFFGKCYTMRKILHLCCKFYFKTQPRSFYNRLKVKSKVIVDECFFTHQFSDDFDVGPQVLVHRQNLQYTDIEENNVQGVYDPCRLSCFIIHS